MASFLSFDDLIENFWEWLLMLEMFALAAWEINQIRECVWNLINVGNRILSKDHDHSGIVVEKKITSEKTKVLRIDWGQTISAEDPAYLVIIQPSVFKVTFC